MEEELKRLREDLEVLKTKVQKLEQQIGTTSAEQFRSMVDEGLKKMVEEYLSNRIRPFDKLTLK